MEGRIVKNVDDLETIRCRSMDEAETSISMERLSNVALIYTSDNSMLTKLKKQWRKNPAWTCYEAGRNSNNEVTGYFFEVPRKAISIRAGLKKNISAESRQKAAERFKKRREISG